jgi:hypothetical protein
LLLRRITRHVERQNWFAVAIDLVIVVVGVFIGIQVSNWNDSLAFERREAVLMRELRDEVLNNLVDVQAKGDGFLVGAAAARRVLAVVDQGTPPCADSCWAMVVDLMHASQWQQLNPRWSIYDELRREGLPSDRKLIELVEKYQTYSAQAAVPLSFEPRYRPLVRRRIPISVQDAYWDQCYRLDDAVEIYIYPCAPPPGVSVDPAIVAGILSDPEIVAALREWTSIARVVGEVLTEPQRSVGEELIRRIEADLRN